jgi:hypothetical protein
MKTKTPEKGSPAIQFAHAPKPRRRRRRAPGLREGPADTAWDEIAKLAGCVEGPEDWAAEHDHYIHGTPKRGNGGKP